MSFSELADRCALPKDDLTRIMRQAIARHVFKEPCKGYVAHTAASRFLIDPKGLDDMLFMALDVVWPASAYLVDSIDKWKGSEEANHTVRTISHAA